MIRMAGAAWVASAGGWAFAEAPPYGMDARVAVQAYLNMPTDENGALPAVLSVTGAFGDVGTLTPAAGVVPYGVNSPLWSDAAVKERWIAVPWDGAGSPDPATERVGFTPTGEWTFPAGTVFVKHFELPVDDNDPLITQRLETRLVVVKGDGSVYGVTYKWRMDESDADLLPGGLNEEITIATVGGGTRTQTWSYPSRTDCLTCHNAAASHVLGVKTRQLNGDLTYPGGVTDNQLRAWEHVGMFAGGPTEWELPALARLVEVMDASASLTQRMRSYIDANCALCHRPGSGVNALFDARYDTPLAQQGLIHGPVIKTLGIAGAKVIVPLDVSKSILHFRDSLVNDARQMPPIAKNVVHQDAVDTLAAWINGMVDTDADTVVDVIDNCPGDPNSMQEDADGDGAGDACDLCPATIAGAAVDAAGCPLPVVGDMDGDGDVDDDDLAGFELCATGPAAGPVSPGCEGADVDGDGDGDQEDFGEVQRCISGADVAAHPACLLN